MEARCINYDASYALLYNVYDMDKYIYIHDWTKAHFPSKTTIWTKSHTLEQKNNLDQTTFLTKQHFSAFQQCWAS